MGAAAQMLCGGAMMVVAGLLLGERLDAMPTTKGLFAVAYLAGFGSIIAFSAYVWLLHHVRPTLAGSYAYVNPVVAVVLGAWRSEEHTSELQSLMRISYAVFCLKKKKNTIT